MHQERVDQEQPHDGEAEEPQPVGLPAPGSNRGTAPGHHGRPEDGGFEAGDQGEECKEQEGGRETGPEAEPSEQRAGGCHDERHVLAGDGEEVSQAGGPEVVGRPAVLGPVVAEHQPGQERSLLGRQRCRPPPEGASQGIGKSVEGAGGQDPVDARHLEGALDVADSLPAPGVAVEVSRHHDPLPCEEVADRGRPRRELGVVAVPVEADLGPPTSTGKRSRVREQPHDAGDGPPAWVG